MVTFKPSTCLFPHFYVAVVCFFLFFSSFLLLWFVLAISSICLGFVHDSLIGFLWNFKWQWQMATSHHPPAQRQQQQLVEDHLQKYVYYIRANVCCAASNFFFFPTDLVININHSKEAFNRHHEQKKMPQTSGSKNMNFNKEKHQQKSSISRFKINAKIVK